MWLLPPPRYALIIGNRFFCYLLLLNYSYTAFGCWENWLNKRKSDIDSHLPSFVSFKQWSSTFLLIEDHSVFCGLFGWWEKLIKNKVIKYCSSCFLLGYCWKLWINPNRDCIGNQFGSACMSFMMKFVFKDSYIACWSNGTPFFFDSNLYFNSYRVKGLWTWWHCAIVWYGHSWW